MKLLSIIMAILLLGAVNATAGQVLKHTRQANIVI
jgi:hypothetical protein